MPRTRPAAQMHGNIGIPASTHEVSSAGLRTHFRGRGAPVPLAVGVTISYLCVRVVGRRGARERGKDSRVRQHDRVCGVLVALCARGCRVRCADMQSFRPSLGGGM